EVMVTPRGADRRVVDPENLVPILQAKLGRGAARQAGPDANTPAAVFIAQDTQRSVHPECGHVRIDGNLVLSIGTDRSGLVDRLVKTQVKGGNRLGHLFY